MIRLLKHHFKQRVLVLGAGQQPARLATLAAQQGVSLAIAGHIIAASVR